MVQQVNPSKKDKWSDFVIDSIGACIAMPEEKKSHPCIIVAYMVGAGKKISFLCMELPPKNKLYTPEDILHAIRSAEGVRNISYADAEGAKRNLYFCREHEGKLLDVLERDYENNRFVGNVAEVYTASLKFLIDNLAEAVFKPGKPIDLHISASVKNEYRPNTYAHAAINAYNACLLGHLFEREELQLETKERKRVKIEVRTVTSKFLDDGVMYIAPIFRESEQVVDYYETEEFNYIDGEDVYTRKYRIIYSNRLNGYNLVRV
ncbi:MAG: hypothetical protein E7663_02835 [Ruminococcaceae bacterium]|nr:hypothetical protein [Oscillospiraceae bacterium]